MESNKILIIFLILMIVVALIYFLINLPNNFNLFEPIVTNTMLGTRGSFGNHLFQIACLVGTGKKIILPTRIKKLPIYQIIDLDSFTFKDIKSDVILTEGDEQITINKNLVYDIRGYRQSYHYFNEDIRNILKPRNQIIKEDHIACHIRRGDYISSKKIFKSYSDMCTCTVEYYRSGINYLKSVLGNLEVIICTDDLEWCKKNLSEFKINNGSTIEDFYCLLKAKGIVTSCSTFSWWAAYLSKSLIVCPYPWFNVSSYSNILFNMNNLNLYYPDWKILNCKTGDKINREEINTKSSNKIANYIKGVLTI